MVLWLYNRGAALKVSAVVLDDKDPPFQSWYSEGSSSGKATDCAKERTKPAKIEVGRDDTCGGSTLEAAVVDGLESISSSAAAA